jgi:tartrate dehydratase alpha subunit/fumarate hydratase class I-like protein
VNSDVVTSKSKLIEDNDYSNRHFYINMSKSAYKISSKCPVPFCDSTGNVDKNKKTHKR